MDNGISGLSGRLSRSESPQIQALSQVVRFVADPKASVAAVILGFFVILAIFAPVIAPYGPNVQNTQASLEQPSLAHPMGTDRLGRDILSRVIFASRISLRIGFIAVAIGVAVGVPVGLFAGYTGGLVDEALMRFVDAMLSFPSLILLLLIITVLGAGVTNVMIALGISSFPVYARLIRAQTLSLREADFVLAARTVGATDRRIMFRHIMPNAIQPVIVQGSLLIGAAILSEAGLSFLGIGITPPDITWGLIIKDGFPLIRVVPWNTLTPGFAIILFVVGVNLLGDRLRDRLDPRLRGSR